jgi:hypothetical protein
VMGFGPTVLDLPSVSRLVAVAERWLVLRRQQATSSPSIPPSQSMVLVGDEGVWRLMAKKGGKKGVVVDGPTLWGSRCASLVEDFPLCLTRWKATACSRQNS